MKNKLIKILVVLMLLQVVVSGTVPSKAATTYTETWASVDTHNPAPEWFQDAKFGIYFHWGVFSVPAFGNEWYPRNMYNSGSGEYNHHVATYGDPYTNWPYHNFINGANNKNGQFTQFAPKLTSEGGKFDPNAWAQLFADAGAKFAGSVAEHHDGFSMWNSAVNEWNSVAKGPKMDLAAQFATAIRAKNLKFLMAMHHAFNFTGFYQWVPAQSDPSLKKLYGQLGKTAEEQLWYDKLKEIIDNYQPDIIWQDFNLSQISESQRLKFLSYYYNKSIDWGKEVVATYKDGFNNKGEVLDYERGGPGDLSYPYWLTDDSISSSSWCYTQGIGYYSTKAMIHSLIDRVSKNGNLLLNIAPMADGTIPQGQKDILLGMGGWLKKYGESIYSTRAWDKFGEGPTKMGGGSFVAPVEGTAQDIRFTKNKTNNVLYAIGMGWPSNNQMVITTLKSGAFDASKITGITFLNGGGSCTWTQDSTGLKINLPSNLADNMGYAVKISLNGPVLTGVTFYQDYNFAGSPVTLTAGNYTASQLAAAGIPNNSVSSIKVPSGLQVEVYDDDNFSGTKWTFTADNANFGSAGCNDAMTSVKIIDNTPPPGPISAFTQIEAESYTTQSGIQTETCNEGGQNAGYIENGDYAVYKNIDFGSGATGFKARAASATSGGSIELRLDSITGTLVGTCPVSGTGDWQNWVDSKCSVSGASGKHDLYLKFTGGSGYLFNLNWFTFTNVPTTTVGDLNGDTNIDATDYALMKMYLLGSISDFPVQDDLTAGDLNLDGVIDALDFAVFKKYLLGDITKLPYTP